MAARKETRHAVIASPVGPLGIVAGESLTCIDFLPRRARPLRATTPLAREVARQLAAYFRDARFVFDLPLSLAGTDYQQRVWRALMRIPAGKVWSYGEVARRIDSGARAVGGACRANPVPIVVPCHRVVAHNGLGGYSGGMVPGSSDIKHWLLQHEGA